MTKNKTFWIGLVAALALGAVGCGDDSSSSNGTGGTAGMGGGTGGMGGMPVETGNVTVAHFAFGVPSAMDTTVVIWINGEASGLTVTYGTATGRQALEAGTYTFGLGTADDELVTLPEQTVEAGDDLVLVAYGDSTGDPLPVNVAVLDASTDMLDAGNGRVIALHGADADALNPVAINNEDNCPPPLVEELPYGASGTLDVPAATYNLALDVDQDPDVCASAVSFGAPVTDGEAVIAVPVLEGEDVNVWGLPAPFDTAVSLLPAM